MNQRHFLRHVSHLLSLTAGLAAFAARADVKLPAIFGDHMVLQRDQKVPVWGWADEDELVIVQFRDQVVQARAGKDGKWSVNLAPMKASSAGKDFLVIGKNRVELKNVVVGEVWFCSGQSNMEWSIRQSKDATQEIAAANNPRIRHFKVPHVTSTKPETEVKTTGGWQPTTPAVAGSFTAVGYFFAREIQKDLDVPIGLIGCNWGGTRIEPWTPPVGFQSVPALKSISTNLHNFPQKNAAGAINQQSALAIYNAMVHPLIPYAIKGALWYQGESNKGEGMLYFEKKKALIGGWRTLWGQGSFPFLFVQLAPYNYGPQRAEHLPGIWEAQTASLSIPNTGMAVTTDIATVSNIHPPDKQEVGRRLALWALAKTYGQPVKAFASPTFDSLAIDGAKARVSLKNADGLKSRDGKPLTWFTIAGADKKFVAATAEIVNGKVVVSSPEVKQPVAVRFGWNQLAEPNLANGAGLPASPFRTDKWTDATMPVVAPPTPPPPAKK